MTATIVDGNAMARDIRADVTRSIAELVAQGKPAPGIAIIQVGEDPSPAMYTRRLQKTFTDSGVRVELRNIDAGASASEAARAVAELSRDASIHGIQIQTPV